ncbi:cell division protein FtsL [Chitiniphilus shinanonensis]|uniref:Cell division protein FtsL n=1 Tax=Chitiniphilus shinanonensis TaxID=553088 RepID=A0ABQ6BRT6_9NEIS|nr:cell division protein FtsL [Chitiniphilus shinanonensis]GLS04067.1 cell division protein FtsL [Chitiniphilus shinanonensis]
MIRLNLFLLGLLMVCAMSVVTSQHKSRKLYSELQKEAQHTKKLDVEWGQLQLEQSTWAMHSRIENEATRKLGMQLPGSNRTQVILPRGTAVARPKVGDVD